MTKPAVDIADVLERVQDDRELLLELLDIFDEDFQEKRKYLDQLMKEKNVEAIKDIAHSLKGAAGNISAKIISGTCGTIENLAEQNNLDEITKYLPTLDKQFSDYQIFVINFKKSL